MIELNRLRQKRFEIWFKHNNFDKLMYRLILEHGEDYAEKCYYSGYKPYPNRKLHFLLTYVRENTPEVTVKKIINKSPNEIYEFNGYYFQLIHDNIHILRIYNKEDSRLLLEL